MNKAYFSVIIPTYNRASTIGDTIKSVLTQTFTDFEIIVVDDGSTDDTELLITKNFSNARVKYIKKQNGERAAARNTGAAMAAGHYVNFVDSDDLLYNNHLAMAYEFIRHHDSPPVFHQGYDIRDREGREVRKPTPVKNINDQILDGNLLSCNGVFIRRDILIDNRFNEDRLLSSLEDWELWVRLCSRYKFLHNSIITSTVVEHPGRSVISGNEKSIIDKVDRFMHCVANDQNNRKIPGHGINRIIASSLSYASLHLAIVNGSPRLVFHYLFAALSKQPLLIFKKRFLVILYLVLRRK